MASQSNSSLPMMSRFNKNWYLDDHKTYAQTGAGEETKEASMRVSPVSKLCASQISPSVLQSWSQELFLVSRLSKQRAGWILKFHFPFLGKSWLTGSSVDQKEKSYNNATEFKICCCFFSFKLIYYIIHSRIFLLFFYTQQEYDTFRLVILDKHLFVITVSHWKYYCISIKKKLALSSRGLLKN